MLRKFCFVVIPSNCHVIILCDVGGGFHWRDTRAAAPAAASRLLSYCQNPGAPPPSRLAGALTHAVSGDRDSQWKQTIDNPQLRGRVDTTVFGPIQYLAWLPLPDLPSLCYLVRDTIPASSGLLRVYTLEDSEDFHLPSLWITL